MQRLEHKQRRTSGTGVRPAAGRHSVQPQDRDSSRCERCAADLRRQGCRLASPANRLIRSRSLVRPKTAVDDFPEGDHGSIVPILADNEAGSATDISTHRGELDRPETVRPASVVRAILTRPTDLRNLLEEGTAETVR